MWLRLALNLQQCSCLCLGSAKLQVWDGIHWAEIHPLRRINSHGEKDEQVQKQGVEKRLEESQDSGGAVPVFREERLPK